jgi:magnesium transporter
MELKVFAYNAKEMDETNSVPEACFPFTKKKNKTTWINVDMEKDLKAVEKISSDFSLHPLVFEDISHTRQRPKVDDYDNYLFIVVRMMSFDEKTTRLKSEQMSMVLGRNYLLTFQEKPGDIFDRVRDAIRKDKGKVRRAGPDFLAYLLLDMVVDNYFLILEKLGEKIEKMEETVVSDPSPSVLQKIRGLKHEMLALRKSVWPLRELLLAMERESSNKDAMVSKDTAVYLRDVYDHTIQVIDTTETFRDTASAMIDIYLSSISNRMNEIMKVLTIIGTIFIPLTFITGLYGMNFKYMPELDHPYAYPLVLLLMLVLGIIMVIHFKKRKWM